MLELVVEYGTILDKTILLHPIVRGFQMRRRLGFAFFFENIEHFWIFLVLSGKNQNPVFFLFEHDRITVGMLNVTYKVM